MLSRTITLATLVDARVPLSWREAVALAQGIAELSEGSGWPEDGDSLSRMALDPTGVVIAPATGSAAVSRSELALFLVQLLRPDGTETPEPTPPEVYDAISRALGLSDEPVFESVAQFSAALKQFERLDRRSALRGVYARCMQRLNYTLHVATTAEREVLGTGGEGDVDRRKTGAQVTAMRRMLRELDREAYLMRAAAEARGKPAERGASVVAAVLPVSALLLAVLLTAAAGTAQRQTRMPQPAPIVRSEPSGAASGDVGPSTMIENRSRPATTMPASGNTGTVSRPPAASAAHLDRSKPPRETRLRAAAERPAAGAGRPVAAAARQVETTASISVPRNNARRWPLRVIAAIRHRLSSAFRGA